MLTQRDKKRYLRQIIIPDWEEAGQERIKNSRVFIAGAGGLGSAVSIYLSAAGIGYLKIVDKDIIEISNLNRQILYIEEDIGRAKAESARQRLNDINKDITIEVVEEEIGEENIIELLSDVDVIVDCMDNFAARFILNKRAVEQGIVFIHGGVWGLGGVVTTIIPGKTPCLKCIFPEVPPSSELFPVLGTTVGVIGSIQATEALKYITKRGDLLSNRLLLYDGESMSFEEVEIERASNCPVCGDL